MDVSSATRLAGVMAAIRGGDAKAVPGLAANYASETEPTIRAWIVRGVARLDPAQGTTLAEKALTDPSAWVRLGAVEALGRIGGPQAAADLTGAIAAEKSAGVRQATAVWLGAMKRPEAEPALARALSGDPEANVRIEAARALKLLGTPAARQDLRGARNDADSRVRGEANEP